MTIAGDGAITVASNAALGNLNRITAKAVYKGVTYTRVFTVGKTLDGESPVTLNLLPDNEVIQCDYLGNPTSGLPLTAKATLYKGTREITAAMELEEAAKVSLIYYPGNIFDPMLGDFYPTLGYPVAWTLSGAPSGVTIDNYGLITVSGTARLSDVNEITVWAAYHGKTYGAVFGIIKTRGGAPGRSILSVISWYYLSDSISVLKGGSWTTAGPERVSGKYIWKKTVITYSDGTTSETSPECITGEQGDPAPRYRGATGTADTGNTGIVNITGKPSSVMRPGDWVMFTGSSGWQYAFIYEWNGASWRQVPREETAYYLDGIGDLTEGAPDGVFSAVFCRILFAQQAAIKTIESTLMQVNGAIYGGSRFTRNGSTIVDNGADKTGFMLGADGRLIASDVIISGTVNATSGVFDDITISGDSLFQGTINSGPLVLSDIIPSSNTIIYNSETAADTIYYQEKQRMGSFTTRGFSVDGTYGDKSINRIIYDWWATSDTEMVDVIYVDGDKERIAITQDGNDVKKLSHVLSFRYTSGGRTFKLTDLPTSSTGISGTVYRDGNTLKIVP